MKKVAIITGVTGQDGSYLADFLLKKDYRVIGVKRRSSSNGLGNASHLEKDIEIAEADLGDLSSLQRLTKSAGADEFYNLAAQSHVGSSFEQPVYTAEASGLGVLNCLEAIRFSGLHTRFYQASTSELYGGISGDVKLNEQTPFHPRSPYGVAKLYGYWITVNYRESYKMFACNGILFNHESPRRGPNFVTRKITMAIAKIKAGLQDKLYLGNLQAKRDWGHAADFVQGMWLMLQHRQADDFVLATGKAYSVADFCQRAFEYAGLGDYRQYVEVDPRFYRPAEVHVLLGDPEKAHRELHWKPTRGFVGLVQDMVDADIEALTK